MAIAGLYRCFDHWHKEGTVWIFSDPHFGDEELRAGVKGRPSDEELVKMINSCVGRKDTLILLGDVGDVEYAKKLRGYKVLICGNHDAGRTLYEKIFNEVYTGPLMIGEKLLLSHEPADVSWAFNIHGHDHAGATRANHLNVCADVVGYKPLNFNKLMKQGIASKVDSIHRTTIDNATKKKKKKK